jgi:superkiller protein 3
LTGRIQPAALTYTRLAEIIEAEEKERINKEIGERRTRIGARIGQVKVDVKREVFAKSNLEEVYQGVIDWSNDDEVRREYEEKLLNRLYDALKVAPAEQKDEKRVRFQTLAEGMVIIKHPCLLAWDKTIEWKDCEDIATLDVGVLREFIDFFPMHGLAEVLRGYLGSEIAPFPPPPKPQVIDADSESESDGLDGIPLENPEDRLVLITEGIQKSPQSLLAHRLAAEYLLFLEEYSDTVEVARTALKNLALESRESGLKLRKNLDAIKLTLATSLIHHQTPRNHPEARNLFNQVLENSPNSTAALIGLGLIFEEEEKYTEAIDFLQRGLKKDPENKRMWTEVAWCHALNGEYEVAQDQLHKCLEGLDTKDSDPRSRDLIAQIHFRIGVCQWNIVPSPKMRKDRKGAYASFLSALQFNMNFAPAYTYLGLYYADYAKDKKRARKCFSKAFELSASEILAAERLARSFADLGDWDLVDIVARRVVDSGKAAPTPGGKRGVSWPFAALGVVELNKQDYANSIVHFQAALRIDPEEYNSWVGLGESYHNSGRYIAAMKALQQAELLITGGEVSGEGWFSRYMLANVKRELGDYEDAAAGYREVLKSKPAEFGVLIALMQTLVEGAWALLENGRFGSSIENSNEAISVAETLVERRSDAFNVWKTLGDACALYSWVQGRIEEFPLDKIGKLLSSNSDEKEFGLLADVDDITIGDLSSASSENGVAADLLRETLFASILAQKRAIHSSADDDHAHAVAWFNLGWAEYRAHECLKEHRKSSKYVKAAIRCFKRSIEIEAGNAEFWNALGVVTSQLSPKVAQHAFVRSLHLNDKNARVWTNLGTLYLLESDVQLANEAFTRAQSTDPDYAHAWLGQGLLAQLVDDSRESQILFEHAFEISDSASVLVKKEYAYSTFAHLLRTPHTVRDGGAADLITPAFALQQLQRQSPSDLPSSHLSTLFSERLGSSAEAVQTLTNICSVVEADYEGTESERSLFLYAHAKADLARAELACKVFESAIENAETALSLSSAEVDTEVDGRWTKCRLSAHLTAGLACFYTSNFDRAVDMFKSALIESAENPDVVCLLAQVLWAKGGETERTVAREQLFECIGSHPEHVGCLLLLAAIGVLDADADVLEAVEDDLKGLLGSDQITRATRGQVGELLSALRTSKAWPVAAPSFTAQISVFITPYNSSSWTQLAEQGSNFSSEDEDNFEDQKAFAAQMALKTALKQSGSVAGLAAEELGKAFANVGTIGDDQRAIMTAPWVVDGWAALGEDIVGC